MRLQKQTGNGRTELVEKPRLYGFRSEARAPSTEQVFKSFVQDLRPGLLAAKKPGPFQVRQV